MNRIHQPGYLALFVWILMLLPAVSGAQSAEITAFDTADNQHAAADRLYYDALKARTLKNDKEAERLLVKYIQLRPEIAAGYYELGRIYGRANDADKALEYARKATNLDTGNKWFQEYYAHTLTNKGEYLAAATTYSNLARRFKPNLEYLLRAARMYQRLSMYKEAIAQLEYAMKDSGPNEDILMEIQQMYVRDKNIDSAAATFRRLIDYKPKEGKFYALMAEMYENYKMPDKAKEVYEEAEKKFPSDISVQLGLASYFKRNKNTAKYDEYIRKAITNTELDAQSQLTLLVSYMKENEKDSSARRNGMLIAADIVRQNPKDATVYSVYGDLLAINCEQLKAVEAYKKSIAADSSNISVWQQLLYNYMEKDYADSLITYSNRAIALFPNQALLHYLRGIGYINKKNYKSAVSAINTAIDFQPEENKQLLAEMYSMAADAYNSLQDYKNSDLSYEKALALDPDNATVLNNYAYYLSLRGERLEDAEKYSKRSLELRPGETTFLDTYGWIFYKQGKYGKAKEMIQQAVDKNPQDADATLLEHLGDTYYKLNNINKAIEYWQKAKDKDPNNEQIEKKLKERKLYE